MTITDSEKWRLARRQRVLDELRGVPRGHVPSGEVRAHVAGLHAMGFSRWAITSAAGLTAKSTSLLDSAVRPGTYLQHSRLYLALTPQVAFERAAPQSKVPSFAAVRRYQALQWLGHTQAVIEAAAVRGTGDHAWCAMLTAGERVSAARHRAMVAAFEALHQVQGASPKTAAMARTKAFLPPIAWDDIDDPNEDPCDAGDGADIVDMIAVERVIEGDGWAPLTSAEVYAAIDVGLARGLSYQVIATRLGMTHDAVTKRVIRARRDADSVGVGVAA